MALQIDNLCAEFGVTAAALAARGLRQYPEATTLEVAEIGSDGREHLLTPAAANAWRELKGEATRAGENLFIVSAFRSVERQIEIIRRKLNAGQAIEDILCVSAFPGFSEHHTGRAVDLSTPGPRPLETEFEATSAFRWLVANAARFGFVLSYPQGNAEGYQYEPWHWCLAE